MSDSPAKIIDESEKPQKPKGSIYLKLAILGLIVLSVVLAFKTTGIGSYFQKEYLESLIDSWGIWAPLGYILIYFIATVLGVPGTIISAIGGIAFGPYLGTLLIVTGATLGASGAFFVAKFLARDFVEEMFGSAPWFKKLDAGIETQGLYFILFIRLVPVFPFNGINFASGLTKVRFRDYFIGTFIGIIPASFVFANVAYNAVKAATGEEIGAGFYLSLVLLALIAMIPMIYKKYKGSKTKEVQREI